jgi:hypothetical protein
MVEPNEILLEILWANIRPRDLTYGQKCSIERHFGQSSNCLCLLVLGSFYLDLELMIGLFLILEVMEPQKNFMEEPYDPSEYKLTWMLVITFSALHVCFIYIKHIYFATFMKYILEPL